MAQVYRCETDSRFDPASRFAERVMTAKKREKYRPDVTLGEGPTVAWEQVAAVRRWQDQDLSQLHSILS